MSRRDNEPMLNQLTPEQLAMLADRKLTPARLKEAFAVIRQQFKGAATPPIAPQSERTGVILQFPDRRAAEESVSARPNDTGIVFEEPLEQVQLPTVFPVRKRRHARGLSRRSLLIGGLTTAAAGLIAAEPVSRVIGQGIKRASEGFDNPPAIQTSDKTRDNLNTLKARNESAALNQEAAIAEDKRVRDSFERERILSQAKFLEDFASRIDKTHNNPNAGDIHRQEAAKLRAKLTDLR